MSDFSFLGDPPYDLPTTQSASANAVGKIVEMTVRATFPEVAPDPAPVRTQMSSEFERKLAEDLRQAALEAEIAASKRG